LICDWRFNWNRNRNRNRNIGCWRHLCLWAHVGNICIKIPCMKRQLQKGIQKENDYLRTWWWNFGEVRISFCNMLSTRWSGNMILGTCMQWGMLAWYTTSYCMQVIEYLNCFRHVLCYINMLWSTANIFPRHNRTAYSFNSHCTFIVIHSHIPKDALQLLWTQCN
jgi:hypothetical protein